MISVVLIGHFFSAPTGDTFHISDIVMGIAVLAAGGSIPEATSGIINARNGKILFNSPSCSIVVVISCLQFPLSSAIIQAKDR